MVAYYGLILNLAPQKNLLMSQASAKPLHFLQSSIGKKLLMSLTGLFLCSFLVIHLIGNLQLYKNDEGLAFNSYSVFMTSNPLIKTVSYLLYSSILFHAFWGLYLVYQNKKARPVAYHVQAGNTNSSWASRNMGILGTVVLVFISVHMADFWYEYKFGHVPYRVYQEDLGSGKVLSMPYQGEPIDAKMTEFMAAPSVRVVIIKDLFAEVSEAFKNPVIVALYVISMFALAFHLMHGFRSGFQTLGVNHVRYNGLISAIGVYGFGLIIPLMFAAMPLYFYLLK